MEYRPLFLLRFGVAPQREEKIGPRLPVEMRSISRPRDVGPARPERSTLL